MRRTIFEGNGSGICDSRLGSSDFLAGSLPNASLPGLSALWRSFPRLGPAPSPIANLRHVLTMGTDVVLVIKQLVTDKLLGMRGPRAQARHAINHVPGQVEAVHLI